MLDQLRALQATFQDASEAATSLEQLEQLRTDFLGRKGKLTALLKGLKDVAPAERGIIGKAANLIKTEIGQALDAAQEKLDQAALEARLASEWLDVTLPAAPSRIGGLHPVSRIQYEIEDIFKGMGFSVLDGPHVELDYYNFEALNIRKIIPRGTCRTPSILITAQSYAPTPAPFRYAVWSTSNHPFASSVLVKSFASSARTGAMK